MASETLAEYKLAAVAVTAALALLVLVLMVRTYRRGAAKAAQ